MNMRRIVYATNDRGYWLLKVAIHSLLKHVQADDDYQICVLEGEGGVTQEHKDELSELIAGRVPLTWFDVDPYLSAHREGLLRINKGRTLMIWARAFIGEILGDVDGNVLYLDTDTYVNGDLGELFDTELGDAIVGMVPEAGRGEGWDDKFDRACMPAGLDVYCNAGVILLNPMRWKREGIGRRMIDWGLAWPDAVFHDQDAINSLACGRLKVLHPKWNYHDGWVERSFKMSLRDRRWRGNPPRSILEAILAPRILHYWGRRKPWRFNHRPERKLYLRAMREVGLVDRRGLPGSTIPKRLTLPFWDAIHALFKLLARIRLRRLMFAKSKIQE